eukprot:3793802-Amphidinium_carterae.1
MQACVLEPKLRICPAGRVGWREGWEDPTWRSTLALDYAMAPDRIVDSLGSQGWVLLASSL